MLLALLSCVRDGLLSLVILLVLTVLAKEGWSGLARVLTRCCLYLPGAHNLTRWYLKKEVKSFLKKLGVNKNGGVTSRVMAMPKKGK